MRAGNTRRVCDDDDFMNEKVSLNTHTVRSLSPQHKFTTPQQSDSNLESRRTQFAVHPMRFNPRRKTSIYICALNNLQTIGEGLTAVPSSTWDHDEEYGARHKKKEAENSRNRLNARTASSDGCVSIKAKLPECQNERGMKFPSRNLL